MKRKPSVIGGVIIKGVRQSLSRKQLEFIGAIAMAYNEAEAALDRLVSSCVSYQGDTAEITSRINGADGKVGIILNSGLNKLKLPQNAVPALQSALGAFGSVKTFRDAVVHSRIRDQQTAIGVTRAKKGKLEEVLLSAVALEWLFKQIEIVEEELNELASVMDCANRLLKLPEPDDQHKERLERGVRDATAQCLHHQHRRQLLKQPPKFPTEEEIRELRKNPIPIYVDV